MALSRAEGDGMNITDSTVSSEDALRRRALELVPVLRERAAESEALRQLPASTLADYEAAEFLAAMRPTEVGGLEISLGAWVDITRTLARGDASAGWVGSFLMSHAWLLTKLSKEAQEDVFRGQPWALAAAAAAPPGRADRVAGGYRISGRWRFASGIMHSTWVILMVASDKGMLTCVVPMSDVTIHDTWQVPGMKATGSNDVEAIDVFVPEYLAVGFDQVTLPDNPGANAYSYPLLRYPMHRVLPLIHPAVAIGVAEAMLDLFRERLGTRVRIQTRGAIADEATTHETYGEAFFAVRCADLMLRNAVEIVDAAFGTDAAPGLTLDQRAELNLSVAGAGVQAFRAVDLLVQASGASALRTGSPIDRICRDTQVMRNHGVLDWRYTAAISGRVLLGKGLGAHAEALF